MTTPPKQQDALPPKQRDALRILGIDPGLGCTGWGMVAALGSELRPIAAGTISSTAKQRGLRLAAIHDQLLEVMQRHQPEEVALETIFVNANAHTSLVLGEARGAAMMALARCGHDPFEYAPNLIKQAVCGHGKAGKEQIATMLGMILPGLQPNLRHDALDALAVALCHIHRRRLALLR